MYWMVSNTGMWSPPQRGGSFEITTPGQSICYLKEPPCGNIPSETPAATLQGGEEFTLLFQQNLNHFYQENPGYLQADFSEIADPTSDEDFYPIGTNIPDWQGLNMITQSNFTMTVTVPNVDCEHCVLRMRYVSHNPTEDHGGSPSFHQCADVKVVKGAETKKEATAQLRTATSEENHDCCAPKKFTIEGYETSNWRNPTKLKYYFDSANQLFRIDSNSGSGETAKDGSFKMFNDFKNGIEYYYNAVTDTCDLYGLNLWYDWCYGSINHQVRVDEMRIGDEISDVWGMDGNDFHWSNTRDSCTPVSRFRTTTGETIFYFNMQEDYLPDDYFDLPSACVEEASRRVNLKNLTVSPSSHQFHGF